MLGKVPVTVSVTGMDSGLLEAPLEVITTEPWYVAAVKPAGFTETRTDPGVGLVAITDNHEPPEVVAAAVKAIAVPPVIVTDCDAGVVPAS